MLVYYKYTCAFRLRGIVHTHTDVMKFRILCVRVCVFSCTYMYARHKNIRRSRVLRIPDLMILTVFAPTTVITDIYILLLIINRRNFLRKGVL